MKIKAESTILGLIYIYLTCYFIQLFGFPDLLMLVLGAAFCLILLVRQKKFRLDIGVCLIAVTMFSYCMIVFGIRAVAIMMPYIPIVVYVLAHYLSKEIKKSDQSGLELSKVIDCLVFGYAVHGVLNSYLYFAGYRWEGTRYWMDVWERQIVPGTQLTAYYLPVFAVVFPAVFYFMRKKGRNAAAIILTLFFCYASLATRTRTTLLILAIVIFVQGMMFLVLEREKIKRILTPGKIAIFLGGILASVIILVLVLKDTEIVRSFIANLGKGGGILNNVRFQVQQQALNQVFDYPFGGNQMILDMKMAHNVWLDMANAAGIIPFLSFAAYTLWTLYELIRFVVKKEFDTEVKLIMVGIYVSFFLYYTVEPALNSSVHFMAPWMLINGSIHGYISNKE